MGFFSGGPLLIIILTSIIKHSHRKNCQPLPGQMTQDGRMREGRIQLQSQHTAASINVPGQTTLTRHASDNTERIRRTNFKCVLQNQSGISPWLPSCYACTSHDFPVRGIDVPGSILGTCFVQIAHRDIWHEWYIYPRQSSPSVALYYHDISPDGGAPFKGFLLFFSSFFFLSADHHRCGKAPKSPGGAA